MRRKDERRKKKLIYGTIPHLLQKIQYFRKRLWELIKVSSDLDEWLEKNNISTETSYTNTGVMIYCEPESAARLVREDIINKE